MVAKMQGSVGGLVITYPFFSETAQTIFMKLRMMLDIDKRKKVTKPDYPKEF